MITRKIVEVLDYDPQWPEIFCRLRDRIWPRVSDVATAIEHVGSTSVPGVAAKPVIDMDIVIPSRDELTAVIERLAALGYTHRGNLGVEDRDAFRAPENQPGHHLYVCPAGSLALRNHIVVRDHLRAHADDRAQYSELKKQLALSYGDDRERYMEDKTSFILGILTRYGFSQGELEAIRSVNTSSARQAT